MIAIAYLKLFVKNLFAFLGENIKKIIKFLKMGCINGENVL